MKTRSKSLAGPLLAYEQFWSLKASARSEALAEWLKTHTIAGGVAGTVTYRVPATVAGTSTAPTAAQVSNEVIADVTMADAATITTITHNLSGITTNGANGDPQIHIVCLTAGATPVGMGVTVSYTTNAVQIANIGGTAAGNGQTYRVQLWRHSLISDFTH